MVSLPVPLRRILDPAHRIRRPDWIEIDKDYLRDINMKRAVIEEHKERVLNSLPENDDASGELLETLIDWLPKVHPPHRPRLEETKFSPLFGSFCKRYPMLFEPLPGGIWNKVTDEHYPNVDKLQGVAALKVVSRYVPLCAPAIFPSPA